MTNTEAVDNRGTTNGRVAIDRVQRITGIAGVAAVVGFVGFLAISSAAGGVNPLTSSRAALAHSLGQRSGSGLALWVLAASAISYVPMLVFLAGLRQVAADLDSSGLSKSIVSIASALFVSGAVAADGFNLALSVAQHAVPSFEPSPSVAVALSAGWLVCLVEAQVALGVMCATVGIAILAGRGWTPKVLPNWLGWWGVIGAVTLVPLLAEPTRLPVFVASNLSRLIWILAVGVAMLRRRSVMGVNE